MERKNNKVKERIISASRGFSCSKNKPVIADIRNFKEIMTIFDLKLGQMLQRRTPITGPNPLPPGVSRGEIKLPTLHI